MTGSVAASDTLARSRADATSIDLEISLSTRSVWAVSLSNDEPTNSPLAQPGARPTVRRGPRPGDRGAPLVIWPTSRTPPRRVISEMLVHNPNAAPYQAMTDSAAAVGRRALNRCSAALHRR